MTDHLHNLLKKANITLVTSESFSDDPRNQIENIKRQDATIIIGSMFEDVARKVFCQAYKEGLTGKGYVWMMMGWYSDNWWQTPDESITCTLDEMQEAVSGYFGIQLTLLNNPETVTVANMTSGEYVRRLKQRLTLPENQIYDYLPHGTTAYDAVWSVGLMLHQASLKLEDMVFADNISRGLEDFTYDSLEMRELFFNLLADVQFEGVSGPVSYENGDRIGVEQLEQMQVGCLQGWHRNENHCYGFMDSPKTWSDAQMECEKFRARLADINQPEDVEFAKISWPSKSTLLYWIGLHQNHEKSIWSDGTEERKPAIWSDETITGNCVALDNEGIWQSRNCSLSIPSICKTEIKPISHVIAYYNKRTDHLRWISRTIWPDNKVPLDHTPEIIITRKTVQKGITPYIYFIMCALAGLGCIMACSFLIFNIKFRQQKFVKLSSPNLNNIIIIGGILIYIWVIVSGIDNTLVSDSTLTMTCQIRMWLLSEGFVLSFGAMFSKTWRVYRVATFKKPKRRVITDQQLLLMVAFLSVVDVIILTSWQIISPWYIDRETGYERDDLLVANQKIIPYFDYCNCWQIMFWLVGLCSYKALLIIFGMFLAWETRKVRIDALNDSKLIGISIYNVVILCTICVAVSFIINDPSTLYIFVASVVLFCTTSTLLTIFVPKIVSVYKYPEGPSLSDLQRRLTVESTPPAVSREVTDLSTTDSSLSVSENGALRKRIVQLEEALRKASAGPRNSSRNAATSHENLAYSLENTEDTIINFV